MELQNQTNREKYVSFLMPGRSGTSLNENLLKESDYLSKLICILIKFRREKYAIMGGIKEMNHRDAEVRLA